MTNPDFTKVEQAIVDRLSPLRDAGLIVHALPERPKEYGELLDSASKGILTLVCFDEQGGSTGADRRLQVIERVAMIYGRVRGLRDEAGLIPVQSAIRNQLMGFRPPKCGAMRYTPGYKFLGRTETDWEFQAGFTFQAMVRGARVSCNH